MNFKLSINRNLINKGDPRIEGWVNAEFSADELVEHVEAGFAFSQGVLKPSATAKKPSSSDILQAQLLPVDIDNTVKVYNKETKSYDERIKTIEEGYYPWDIAQADAWLHDNALLIYTTASHTTELNKFRIVFLLPEPVSDPVEYAKIAEAFIEKYGSDKACKNIDRLFYGSQNCEWMIFKNQLKKKELLKILTASNTEKKFIKKYENVNINGDLTPEKAEEMLSYIPKQPGYTEWFKILSAIGNHFDESTAIRLIENWSPDEKYGTAYKIKHRGRKTGIGTLIYYAKNYGYDESKFLKPLMSHTKVNQSGEILDKESQLKVYPLTELGNSERFVDQWANKLKFNHTSGKWHIWTGQYWEEDQKNRILQFAKKTVRNIYNEMHAADGKDKKSELFKHAIKSETKAQMQAMLVLAGSAKNMAVIHSDFDVDPYLLNLKNGTYHLRTNEFKEHDPRQLLSKCIDINYDPEAHCYLYEDFCLTVYNNNLELIQFVQRALGLTLCGAHLEEILFFCYGTGKNGKSIFFNILNMVFGDYYQKAPSEMLILKYNDTIPNDIARLPGARFVVAEELPENRTFDENRIKNLTGGDKISARFLHKEFFDFQPTHTLWIYGNHKPNIKGSDEGIWRRICIIPFEVEIPENERRTHNDLMADFEIEKSGILNWIIQGWKDYQEHGLMVPDIVRMAVKAYRDEQNKVLEFVQESCEIDTVLNVPKSKLFERYLEWCKKLNEYPIAKNKFYKRIEDIEGIKSFIGNSNQKYFQGIDFKTDYNDQQRSF